MARLIVVIEVQTTRGHGASKDDPIRTITQYWSVEGEGLLAESPDPYDPLRRLTLTNQDGKP